MIVQSVAAKQVKQARRRKHNLTFVRFRCANRTYQAPALIDNEISCETLGTAVVTIGTSGVLSFANVAYTATVSSSSVAYSVGELVKQSLTFKVKS